MNLESEESDFPVYHHGKRKVEAADLPFVAWDGEGVTPPGEDRQHYVLFGNSDGLMLRTSGNGLSTHECLALMIEAKRHNPAGIHVGFAFSYDAEMILKDLDEKHLRMLRVKGYVLWHGYRIEYKRGKWLQVTHREGKNKVTCRIWDCFAFFSTSFLVAVQEYLGDIPEYAALSAGKGSRSLFTIEQMDDMIIPYWQTELRLLVQMMNTLRERLYGADLRIRQWHGPGAISSYALRVNKVAAHMDKEIPQHVNTAAQYAYAGGRFELFRVGHEQGKVYAYDIRSAYPAAIAELPSLAAGEWVHVERPTSLARFGVYRVKFASPSLFTTKPMPFYYRDPRHAIHFPNQVEGWYWSPEAELAFLMPGDAQILEGYEFHEDGQRPFAWVQETYEQRAKWKREGNPSQIALKLLLNSMYGKMAQRVGWERTGKQPTWHQLEWAGWVTSAARAKLFRAMLLAYRTDDLIGVETDGIFTRAPLPLDVGPGLGQWECEEYDGMIYLQSGFYYKRAGNEWIAKYRGFDRGSVTVESALSALRAWRPWDKDSTGTLEGTTTRFTTMGSYLMRTSPEEHRNRWVTSPRTLSIGQDGKRIHREAACNACSIHASPADMMHDLTVAQPIGGKSQPHNLPWLAADTNPFRGDDDIHVEDW